MKVAIKYAIVIFALWFSIHTIAILVDGLNDERIKSDVGVVLGNKVNPDGSLSERLISRLDKALELYNDSTIRLIFVSGGLGKEGFYEGTKMYDYLAENGVPKERIIVDDFGNTTEATAINFQKLNLNAGSVLVVSQYYHISRTKLAFRNAGFKKINGVHAEYFEIRDFYSIIREFVGYYKYLLD